MSPEAAHRCFPATSGPQGLRACGGGCVSLYTPLLGEQARVQSGPWLFRAWWVEVESNRAFATLTGLHMELEDIAKLKSECRPPRLPVAGRAVPDDPLPHRDPASPGGGH